MAQTRKDLRGRACGKVNHRDVPMRGMYILIRTHLEDVSIDIVNIGLHFFLKNVRPYAASCSEA